MKQKHTQEKKARRFNNWLAYQKEFFSTSVLIRRMQGFFGADADTFSAKHKDLDAAVEGYKSRLAVAQQGYHNRV